METLRGIGGAIVGICVALLVLFLGIAFFHGMTWGIAWLMQFSAYVTNICFVLCLFVFLPTAFYWRTRKLSAIGFFICANIFFNITIAFAFLITYSYWGGFISFIGLSFGIIPIIPMGMVAAALHSDWPSVIQCAIGIIVSIATCGIASWLARMIDRRSFKTMQPS